jgi:hypothetical protein
MEIYFIAGMTLKYIETEGEDKSENEKNSGKPTFQSLVSIDC